MKGFRFFIGGFVFVLILSALAFAQAEKTPNTETLKIAAVNSEAFEDKTNGIKEIVEAYDKLEIEFKPRADELKLLFEKYNAAADEIKKILPPPSAPYFYNCFASPIEDKITGLKKLLSEIENKQEEAKKLYETRKPEIFAGVNKKISEALKQFAKERGYFLMKSEPSMFVSDTEDVTKEFIKYYNENFAQTELR